MQQFVVDVKPFFKRVYPFFEPVMRTVERNYDVDGDQKQQYQDRRQHDRLLFYCLLYKFFQT
jgi:hypothetical protein